MSTNTIPRRIVRKEWRCESGHGLTQEIFDPDWFEISGVRMRINPVDEGDPCGYMPIWLQRDGDPGPDICRAPMRLQSEVVLREAKAIPKDSQSAIIPDHKQQLLRRIGNAQAEIGRLNKLLDEIRADVLHLTTE